MAFSTRSITKNLNNKQENTEVKTTEVAPKKQTNNNVAALIKAGTLSGFVSDSLAFPFSTIKTAKMTQGAAKDTVEQLGGLRHSCSHIYRTQGLGGFYRGMSPVLVTTGPGTTLYFGGVQVTKDLTNNSPLGNALAGFVGQLAGSIVWVPSEVLKELRQTPVISAELKNKNVSGLVSFILKTEGITGLYRGFIPQLAKFGPFNSMGNYFSSQMIGYASGADQPTLPVTFAGYSTGFALSALLTTIPDNIKTRMQVRKGNEAAFPYNSVIGCVKTIVKTEGPSAFVAGAVSHMAWAGVRQGTAYALFGKMFSYFSKPSSKNETSTPDNTKVSSISLRR